MSAVVAELPTVQARQHIEGLTVEVAVGGWLQHPAAVRVVGAPGQEVVLLEVWIEQRIDHHPKAVPIFAAWAMPVAPGGLVFTTQAAHTLAAAMPAGTHVYVRGSGLEPGNRGKEPVLRVIKPSRIARATTLREEPAHASL